MSTPFELIQSRLHKFRLRQPGQASACCPAHDDRGPSLSVRETPEGAVLLHCFGGCSVSEVVSALGLELADLFPPRERPRNAPRKIAKTLTPGQALELLENEANLIAIAGGIVAEGRALSESDRERVMLAAGRVLTIAREARHA
jgi:hypothetical protein